ncbi:MAG: DUF6155 family protein [Saprospiraceae bacterium]|nr:DUF6155 family protein [Saprospiraceae bacterium]
MSKKELRKYISGLKKHQLEDQIINLYSTFKEVKEFYDFSFNPNEAKLVEECKFKISKEYFPVSKRKPKARRSVAQKYIRHFIKLGMESSLIADIMLYNIEIAQSFSSEKKNLSDSFYTSILKSFEEAIKYINENGLQNSFNSRIFILKNNPKFSKVGRLNLQVDTSVCKMPNL